MNPIHYKLDLIDQKAEENTASRIDIRDAHTQVSIGNMYAPLIMTLEKGEIKIFKDAIVTKTVSYNEGFLTCSNNQCHIQILN